VGQKLKSAASRVRGEDVNDLCKTACSNMEVGVSGDVQREVDDALRTGKVTRVNAPLSTQKEKKTDDFAGLDDLIGTSSNPHRTNPNKPVSKPTSHALDDLDSLLDGPSKPKTQPVKTAPVQSQPPKKAAFDDLDDLLSGSTPVAKPQPKPQQKFDDLDDLLSGMAPTSNKPPPKTQTKTDDFDDLDSLLNKPAAKPVSQPKPAPKSDMDDIDSLLADMQPPSKGKPGAPRTDDDIDSLLADLGANRPKQGAKGKSSSEIDDLLADLI